MFFKICSQKRSYFYCACRKAKCAIIRPLQEIPYLLTKTKGFFLLTRVEVITRYAGQLLAATEALAYPQGFFYTSHKKVLFGQFKAIFDVQ